MTTTHVADTNKLDDLDAAYAAERRDPYRFRWSGQAWVLPHIGELDYRLQQEIENSAGLGTADLESLFARCFGEEQAERWAKVSVPINVLFMLFERWLKFCGAEMGEPPASTDSSDSTGEKSRPTSDTTTGSGSPKRSSGRKGPAKKAAPAKGAPAKRAPRKPAAVTVELPEHPAPDFPPGNSST